MAGKAETRRTDLQARFEERLKRFNSMDIVSVAQGLGLELRQKSNYYYWEEHDTFRLYPDRNRFMWWSRDTGGSVIDLVRTVKKELSGQEVSFNQAVNYLQTGDFNTVEVQPVVKAEPFSYYLAKSETKDLLKTRDYLKNDRGLSDETIDFFIQSGNLAQADYVNYQANLIEPVIVFKARDLEGQLVGASLQGIENHPEIHERGHLKQLMKRSDGLSGFSVDIGQPQRLVFAEAPIDLMSYYEVRKADLKDVRLVAMDGLKKGTISHYTLDLLSDGKASQTLSRNQLRTNIDEVVRLTDVFRNGENADLITLAVDNDEAGQKFIDKLQADGIPVVVDIPPKQEGQEKMDWNDYLKQEKSEPSLDNSRLAQARRKLNRLEGELRDSTQAVFDHVAQANGQPMNDKRGGDAFFRRANRLEERAISKSKEIEAQRERVEHLEWQAENREQGLNRQGTGLEMSVRNIPRIREEIEKSKKGESVYTKATIKRYEKELERLEEMARRNDQVSLSTAAQELVEAGELNQWQKQPTTYFVKGLKKVALEMDETGNLVPSQKYRPKTDKERERVEELLQQLKRPEKGADMSEPEEKQGVLFENLNDITTRDKTEEKTFIDSLNKENLVTSLELMQKYSVAEVGLNRPYYMGDDHRFEEATIELSHINTSSLNDFVQRYIVPKNEWEDVLEAYENLSYETLSNKLVDQGVLNADQLPQEKPWQPKIITEPITSYEVVEDNNHKEQFSSAEELIDYVKKIISSDQLQKLEHILSEPGRGGVLDSLMIIDSDTADIDYGISLNGESLLELFPDRINKEVTEVTKTVTRTEEELLENNQVLSQAASKNLEKTNSEPDLQVVFHSSDENLLSDNYSSGDIIPYDTFIRALYTENNGRLEAMPAEDIPVFPPLHITNEGGTWFDLRDENGQPLVENIRYDIGGENQTISERLEKVLPSDYLEIARQKDATYPKPVLPEAVSQDSGIPVDLYTGHQNFGTIDFNDLLDSSDLGSHADKLGYGWAVDPRETFAVINNETLSQTQVDKIIDRMFATGADGNDLKQYLQNPDFSLSNYAKTGSVGSQSQEKPLDNNQETPDSNDSDLMAHKKNETMIGDFSEQAQEAAPLPEAMKSQPLKDSSLSQSESHSLLQFTIENPEKSRYKAGYHPINQRDLTKLNNYAENIQNSAQWYLNNLADSTIHYFYQRDGKQYNISIGFEERHFMHFTGLFPLKDGQTAEKTLHDFAEGRGNYDNLLIANRDAAFQKVKVLPDLKAVLETDSFYFDQVSDIPKLHSLNMEKAIKSDDRDVLLAFSSNGENVYPASLMELTKQLNLQSNQSDYQNVILGIYRERDGQLEQVAINDTYVKDNGKEMMTILQENQALEHQALIQEEMRRETDRQRELRTRDSDGDGLTDEEELARGTNPYSADTDGDGTPDGMEVAQGTDPTNALSNAAEQSRQINQERDLSVSELIKTNDRETLNAVLEEKRQSYLEPENYKNYLSAMGELDHYSPRNFELIMAQYPQATRLKSYGGWKKIGGQVQRGEKAILIAAPVIKPILDKNKQPVIDPKTGQEMTKTFFRTEKLFDISQTKGANLSQIPSKNWQPKAPEDYNNIYRTLKNLAEEKGLAVKFVNLEHGEKGQLDLDKSTILLQKGSAKPEEVLTTLVNKLAEAEVQTSSQKLAYTGENPKLNPHLQAESMAYLVSRRLGLNHQDSYQFSALNDLPKTPEGLQNFEFQLATIQKEASRLMARIDEKMGQYQTITQAKTKGKTVDAEDAFHQKLNEAKQEVQQRSQEKQAVTEESYSKKEERTLK